ncbi:MAG: EF-P lysine aminoacylase EpmA [Hyphomonadaceae bacterium]
MTPTPYWDKARHADRRGFLAARAKIAQAVRAWFNDQGFLEAEPNLLVPSPGAETHIDAYDTGHGYLHTSPEFAMKRLLAAGEDKLFYLGKCWRKGESGPLHAPEFTMIEWYRANAPYQDIMADCVAILRVACEAADAKTLRWRGRESDPFAEPELLAVSEPFRRRWEISLLDCPKSAFAKTGVRFADDDNWSDVFSRVLVEKIEPELGMGRPTLFYEYPACEAALARLAPGNEKAAERFELYACGVELANGFGELTDAAEQRRRLAEAMDEKEKRYGQRWPIDEDFLAALTQMPPASGVAMGFDRLVMLAAGARHINDVLWTPT